MTLKNMRVLKKIYLPITDCVLVLWGFVLWVAILLNHFGIILYYIILFCHCNLQNMSELYNCTHFLFPNLSFELTHLNLNIVAFFSGRMTNVIREVCTLCDHRCQSYIGNRSLSFLGACWRKNINVYSHRAAVGSARRDWSEDCGEAVFCNIT